jgi:hypothetical protein
MSRRALLPASVVALVLAGAAGAEGPKLVGTVGPGFSISLVDAAGARVTQLAPGPYELEVDDLSEEHNFHLTGPGVDVSTQVSQTGKATFQLQLQDGSYRFVCDPHALQMRGMFTVGAGSPPAAPAPAAPSLPRVVVTAGARTIALRLAGKAVKRLKPGRYMLVARDRSARQNVHVLGAGVNRRTTVPFTGVRSWTVTLRKGTLVFRSDAQRKLRGAVTVA